MKAVKISFVLNHIDSMESKLLLIFNFFFELNSIPDFYSIVQECKQRCEGESNREHGYKAKLDDYLQVLIEDHGRPCRGHVQVTDVLLL